MMKSFDPVNNIDSLPRTTQHSAFSFKSLSCSLHCEHRCRQHDEDEAEQNENFYSIFFSLVSSLLLYSALIRKKFIRKRSRNLFTVT